MEPRPIPPRRQFYESLAYIQKVAKTAPLRSPPGMDRYLDKVEKVVELGCGTGSLSKIHPNYIGLDLSLNALKYLANGRAICCDIAQLPLKTHSIPLMLSVDTLEHIPQPENVLEEIDRVLQQGGMMIHNDAWLCRRWTHTGITVKDFGACSLKEKLFKVLIAIYEFRLLRVLFLIIKRAFFELCFAQRNGLRYVSLVPNYHKVLTTDADAAASIDSHALLLWYRRRGYTLVSAKTFWSRILHRGSVIVQKRERL